MRNDILTETLDGIEMPVVAIFVDAKWFYKILRGERKYYISKTIPHEGMPFKVIVASDKVDYVFGEFICRRFDTPCNFLHKMELIESHIVNGKLTENIDTNYYRWEISNVKQYPEIKSKESFGIKKYQRAWMYIRKLDE